MISHEQADYDTQSRVSETKQLRINPQDNIVENDQSIQINHIWHELLCIEGQQCPCKNAIAEASPIHWVSVQRIFRWYNSS